MNTKQRIEQAHRRIEQAVPARSQDVPSVPIAGALVRVEDLPRGAGQLYQLTDDLDLSNKLLGIKIMWGFVKKGERPAAGLYWAIIRYKWACLEKGHKLPQHPDRAKDADGLAAAFDTGAIPAEYRGLLFSLSDSEVSTMLGTLKDAGQYRPLYADLSDEELQRTMEVTRYDN